jgi:UDP-2,4-diacetamido-2,4,6-trideoxy-beta-L-altropyranose hydrolase
MKIAFRVDASHKIGTGHVMRCLTLADELKALGAACFFICREHEGHLFGLIESRGFEIQSLGAPEVEESDIETCQGIGAEPYRHSNWLGVDEEIDAREALDVLNGASAQWVVIDHYGIGAFWERMVKSSGCKILVIDDLADRPHECDMLLDQNYLGESTTSRYESLLSKDVTCFLGPKYTLLRPEFSLMGSCLPARDGEIHRILIFMGGSDLHNDTLKIVEVLNLPQFSKLTLEVVLGVNHPDPHSIVMALQSRPKSHVHRALPSLVGLMCRCDFMIGAGGTTTWERMCLGLPSLVLGIAHNQLEINRALAEAGLILDMGDRECLVQEDLIQTLEGLFSDPELLKNQSQKMMALVDGKGAKNIAQRMMAS